MPAEKLILTKLQPPFTRSVLVSRPRLQSRVEEGLRGPLTLIAAPAGFGKTTLAAHAIAEAGIALAWLSLDSDDNQMERLLGHLIAALRKADAAIGDQAGRLLDAPHGLAPQAILTSLLNDLNAADSAIALVLDDYQVINSQAVHDLLAFILAHCPANLHLVIATRADPPLPISRLRARGQCVELRAADLRFTTREAAQFLNEVMGLNLDAGSIAVLEQRTEGWAAGLQMAALSMRNRDDLQGFIQGFSGTNRYILDYLLDEVLAGLPPEIRKFLLNTSILRRFSAPLCDAVLAENAGSVSNSVAVQSHSPDRGRRSSRAVLEYLEQTNLFLVPLDDERIWFRYHHLFSDLLRTQLAKELAADEIVQLQIRAADWHAEHGSVLEAIHHASMASDAARVERFIEQNYMQMASHGEMARIRSWIGGLNRELVYQRPRLCIYEAFSHAWFGELEQAIQLLNEAEKRMQSGDCSRDDLALRGHLTYVKGRITAMQGDIDQAIALCLEARKTIPSDHLTLQMDSRITLGYAYYLHGDFSSAGQCFTELIHLGVRTGAVINSVAASCVMARMQAIQGRLHAAHTTVQTASGMLPEQSSEYPGLRALLAIGFADLYYEWNDLQAARAQMRAVMAGLSDWDKADDLTFAYATQMRIDLARGDFAQAGDSLQKASRLLQERGVFSEARSAFHAARVRLWLAQGDLQAAGRWAASLKMPARLNEQETFKHELLNVCLARVWIATNNVDEALGLLTHLEAYAQSNARIGRLLEILLLQALALQAKGDQETAHRRLKRALELAEPQGYARIFLDEGRPMRQLLVEWMVHAAQSPLKDYADALIAQFDQDVLLLPLSREEAAPSGTLVDPLTPRELDVLQLMALGHTNKQIASRLIISPGTVKAHTAGIYRKLDVANRTQAVARARHLGLLR